VVYTEDSIWDALEAIQSHIRAFDTKAQIAIGLNAAVISLLIAELSKASESYATGFGWRLGFTLALAFLSLGFSIVAIILGVRVVHPQLNLNQPYSRFFFCHLADRYRRDFAGAAQELLATTEGESIEEVASQIAVNSFVCNVKAKRCKPVLLFTTLAFGLYAASIIPLVSLNLSMGRLNPHLSNPIAAVGVLIPPVSHGIEIARSPSLSAPVAAIGGALLALLGALIGSVVTRLNAKEQNALASRMKLADFREAWIQRFREAGAELIGLLEDVQSPTPTPRAFELAAKIRLMMNRKDKRYPRLIEILAAIKRPGQTNPDVHAEQLEECIQAILKDEWGVLKNDLKYAPPAVKS
jgi:hypothetical protein